MALTNAQIRVMKEQVAALAANPGLHPNLRQYVTNMESMLGSGGEGVMPTTTTSSTTTTTTTTTTA